MKNCDLHNTTEASNLKICTVLNVHDLGGEVYDLLQEWLDPRNLALGCLGQEMIDLKGE